MRIVFLSNFMNHHQLPLSQALLKQTDGEYHFVACEELYSEQKQLGFEDMNQKEFVIRPYEDENQNKRAHDEANDADVVIIGSAPEKYIFSRLKQNKLTFKYSERLHKKKLDIKTFPRAFISQYLHHGRYQKYPFYMLCASAYTAADVRKFGNYKNRLYKWGYFPETKKYDLSSLFLQKNNDVVQLLWAGRLIDWKKTCDAINIAKRLDEDGYDFCLKIIGTGLCEKTLREQIKRSGLLGKVVLLGAMAPEKVREHMEQANIYLFTSDFNEGWGAVLNESMNSGCAVVANHAIGAVPFLMKDSKNGLIYQNGNIEMFYEKVKYLFDHPEKQKELGQKAYETIINTWNAETAAERYVALCKKILDGDNSPDLYKDGPCSKAEVLKNNWFQ